MAARRRRRWIAIGGATAAVAIGGLSALAFAAPTGSAAPPHARRPASRAGATTAPATSYDVERTPALPGRRLRGFTTAFSAGSPFDDATLTADGTYCYHVVGHYSGAPDVTSAAAPVLYDATPPIVQITNPIASPWSRGRPDHRRGLRRRLGPRQPRRVDRRRGRVSGRAREPDDGLVGHEGARAERLVLRRARGRPRQRRQQLDRPRARHDRQHAAGCADRERDVARRRQPDARVAEHPWRDLHNLAQRHLARRGAAAARGPIPPCSRRAPTTTS